MIDSFSGRSERGCGGFSSESTAPRTAKADADAGAIANADTDTDAVPQPAQLPIDPKDSVDGHMRADAMGGDTNNRICVHATNVTGLGASQVVKAILGALETNTRQGLDCFIPAHGPFADVAARGDQVRFHRLRRVLPNSMSRLFECLFSRRYFPTYRHGITLGDIPLTNLREQVVLVHQLHLVSPKINPFAYDHLNARTMRWLFRRNIRYAKRFVVQTGATRQDLEATYPELVGRVVTVPQPAPPLFAHAQAVPRGSKEKLRLFYPAAGYPHKNHRILQRMQQVYEPLKRLDQVTVTLEPGETNAVGGEIPWVHNAGRLKPSECLAMYQRCDALFFPSTAESYGLPLVEAMTLGLPVVCSDLPYARWLCEDQAIYFDPTDPRAAWLAIAELDQRLLSGWSPDWTSALAKLPTDWDQVGRVFLDLLFEPSPADK